MEARKAGLLVLVVLVLVLCVGVAAEAQQGRVVTPEDIAHNLRGHREKRPEPDFIRKG
jgi:hypothetical protein